MLLSALGDWLNIFRFNRCDDNRHTNERHSKESGYTDDNLLPGLGHKYSVNDTHISPESFSQFNGDTDTRCRQSSQTGNIRGM